MSSEQPCPACGGTGKLRMEDCFPAYLRTPAFAAVFSEWQTARRKRLTKTGMKRVLDRLYPLSEAEAREVVELSLQNGWMGLFPQHLFPARYDARGCPHIEPPTRRQRNTPHVEHELRRARYWRWLETQGGDWEERARKLGEWDQLHPAPTTISPAAIAEKPNGSTPK